jgi:hypothetical protein
VRRPAGFRADFRASWGFIYSAEDEDGAWVVLAGWPDVKIDNKHRDGRPHLHADGIEGNDRRDLRMKLTRAAAVRAVRKQLETTGRIDPDALAEGLG